MKKQEKKRLSEDLMEALGEEVTLESFVPQYLNQAITFTGDDMGSDRAMITMLLLYDHCDHCVCIWNHDQQYDP